MVALPDAVVYFGSGGGGFSAAASIYPLKSGTSPLVVGCCIVFFDTGAGDNIIADRRSYSRQPPQSSKNKFLAGLTGAF